MKCKCRKPEVIRSQVSEMIDLLKIDGYSRISAKKDCHRIWMPETTNKAYCSNTWNRHEKLKAVQLLICGAWFLDEEQNVLLCCQSVRKIARNVVGSLIIFKDGVSYNRGITILFPLCISCLFRTMLCRRQTLLSIKAVVALPSSRSYRYLGRRIFAVFNVNEHLCGCWLFNW